MSHKKTSDADNNNQSDEINVKVSHKRVGTVAQIIGIFTSIVVGAAVIFGFYFNTTKGFAQQGKDITEIKLDISDLKKKTESNITSQRVTEQEIKDMKEWMKRVEDKQDKILEIVLDLKKK